MSEEFRKNKEVSVMNWIGTMILMAIPVVNLIMLIIWAVSCKRPSKRNYAVASLVMIVIGILLLVLGIAFYGQQIVKFVNELDAQTLQNILPQATTPVV